jgi:arylsulfatase A-like enzyme
MGIDRPNAPDAAAPNLLFITTDHQRADSLGMVQDSLEITPHLNRLAARSLDFRRAYTTSPLCVPARTALATGKYPTKNGVVFNDWKGLRAGDHRTLHQYLAEAGYDMGHAGPHHIRVDPELKERIRFSLWMEGQDHRAYLKELGLDPYDPGGPTHLRRRVFENYTGEFKPQMYSSTRRAPWPHGAETFLDSFSTRHAESFVRRRRSGPFALFLNIWAPHPPYRVPEPYFSLFDPTALTLPANVGVPSEGEPENRRKGVAAQLAEGVEMAEWREAWAAHLGLVKLADTLIGRLFEALRETGQEENTVVLFTVDHGDLMGQHAMFQKMEMYEPAIRIPLILHVPGTLPSRIEQPVSHLDVLPTLLCALGMEQQEELGGLNLLQPEPGNPGTGKGPPVYRPVPEDRSLFCQYSGNPTIGDIRRAVMTKSHKYIYDPLSESELYDLSEDPLEMHNLIASGAGEAIAGRLHARSVQWAESHNDWVFKEL